MQFLYQGRLREFYNGRTFIPLDKKCIKFYNVWIDAKEIERGLREDKIDLGYIPDSVIADLINKNKKSYLLDPYHIRKNFIEMKFGHVKEEFISRILRDENMREEEKARGFSIINIIEKYIDYINNNDFEVEYKMEDPRNWNWNGEFECKCDYILRPIGMPVYL